jgi:TRAP-type C4-dicarboxylate transport system substrate-binding protein
VRNLLSLSIGVASALLAACTPPPGADKAGGPGNAPVTLTLAVIGVGFGVSPSVAHYAERVNAVSSGTLRIRVVSEWGAFASDAEEQVVRATAAGKVDLGWTGTRVFDSLGVRSFQALSAPMLIDSNELVRTVLASGVPGRMLRGLREVEVTGLAVFGGGIRVPVAVKQPLRSPPDWRGLAFGMVRSTVQRQAVAALGATPVEVIGPFRVHALDTGQIQGYEFDAQSYATQNSAVRAPFVTMNVPLWPQTDVLFGNPGRLGSLSDAQRSWLTRAAADTARASVDLARPAPGELARACSLGARFVEASPADVNAMRAAFATVYASLSSDADTRAFIDDIVRLRSTVAAGVLFELPSGCAG